MSRFSNIFYVPLIYAKVQQAVLVLIENISKTLFSFLLQLIRKCINQKKLNVKTLSPDHILKGHTKVTNSDSAIWACCGQKLKGSDSVFKVTPIIYIVRLDNYQALLW